MNRFHFQATTTGVDFGPHITGIIFSKIQNGYWVPIGDGESVKEGDQVRFYISYNRDFVWLCTKRLQAASNRLKYYEQNNQAHSAQISKLSAIEYENGEIRNRQIFNVL